MNRSVAVFGTIMNRLGQSLARAGLGGKSGLILSIRELVDGIEAQVTVL